MGSAARHPSRPVELTTPTTALGRTGPGAFLGSGVGPDSDEHPPERTPPCPPSPTADRRTNRPAERWPDDPGGVDTLRTQIDALDAAIGQLIAERAQLSRRIQLARLNAGGPRVELGRERAIHQHYRAALGEAGGMVAEAVLRVCRGSR